MNISRSTNTYRAQNFRSWTNAKTQTKKIIVFWGNKWSKLKDARDPGKDRHGSAASEAGNPIRQEIAFLIHNDKWGIEQEKSDREIWYLEGSGGEFDTDGGLGLEAELIAGEAGQDVGFAHARVADQHDLEQVVVLLVRSPRHRLRPAVPRAYAFASVSPFATALDSSLTRESGRNYLFEVKNKWL